MCFRIKIVLQVTVFIHRTCFTLSINIERCRLCIEAIYGVFV